MNNSDQLFKQKTSLVPAVGFFCGFNTTNPGFGRDKDINGLVTQWIE